MTDEERFERVTAFLNKESDQPTRYWWLSFADSNLPKGKQFLGVAVVKARGYISAIQKTHRLGINPGGEVAFEIAEHQTEPPENWSDRLVTDKNEIERLVGLWREQSAIIC